ncbi:PLP-dependent transferase [Cytidiella melzeri]|nr:PLP-dependent transferase [Cytidiella melzeri]
MSIADALSDISADRYTYDPNSAPPQFGKAARKYWAFDDTYINVNHGSYGSLPLPVKAEVDKLLLLAERNPDRFHRLTYMPLLDKARREVANLVGAEHDEIVLVPNATHGLNTVLRNIEWREGDILLATTTTYNAVERTLQYLSDRSEQPHPFVHSVMYSFPMSNADIIAAFHAKIRELKQKHSDRQFNVLPDQKDVKTGNRFVAVIDSISSMPGVLLPWKELVKICREEGVWTVVDAAHSIGQELHINLGEAKPDFWVSNCHKWLYAKRGCAALYVPRRNQPVIKSSVPTSHAYVTPHNSDDNKFVGQHEWTGTTDQTPFISVTHALAFRRWLGGEEKINAYCHKLAREGGKRLAELFGTRLLDESGEQTLSMVMVQMPLPVESTLGSIYTPEIKSQILNLFNQRLVVEQNTFIAYHDHNGAWWTRVSVQVFTDMSDFEFVAKALGAVCKEAKETIIHKNELPAVSKV